MIMRQYLLGGAAALMFTTGAATTAEAQAAAPPASATPSTALAEVVVTARRRAENLQSVPVAVTAFTAQMLEEKHVTDKTALADFTPSMITITGGYPSEFAYFALRGQGPAFGSVPASCPISPKWPIRSASTDGSGPISISPASRFWPDRKARCSARTPPAATSCSSPSNRPTALAATSAANTATTTIAASTGPSISPSSPTRCCCAWRESSTPGWLHHRRRALFPRQEIRQRQHRFVPRQPDLRPNDRIELYTIGRYYYSDNNGPGTVLEQLNPAIVGAYGPYFPGPADALTNQQALGIRKVSYDINEFSKTEYWQILNHATFRVNEQLAAQEHHQLLAVPRLLRL